MANPVEILTGENSLLDTIVKEIRIFSDHNSNPSIEIVFTNFSSKSKYQSIKLAFLNVLEYSFYHNQDYIFYNVETFKFLKIDGGFYLSLDPGDETENPSNKDMDYIKCTQVHLNHLD